MLPLVNHIEQIHKTDLESLGLDLDTIVESQHKLYSVILRLNLIRNSRAPINKLILDILYDIFTCAVYTAEDHLSVKTALAISHVCQHWRKSALEWPTLWRFINSNKSPKFTELFLYRSQDAPLKLYADHFANDISSKLNLKSYANRLRYLILVIHPFQLFHALRLFQDPELQPLLLRHLQVTLIDNINYIGSRPLLSLTEFIRLDVAFLQSLDMRKMDLPSTNFPPHNVLTRFIFHSDIWHPPTLLRLLDFLSNCLLLRDLTLKFSFCTYKPELLSGPYKDYELNFPKLERLVLESPQLEENMNSSSNISRFNYLRLFSSQIWNMGLLSYFSLNYDFRHWYKKNTTKISPLRNFATIPAQTFSHFADHGYLFIDIFPEIHGGSYYPFHITSGPKCRGSSESSLSSLSLKGTWGTNHAVDSSLFQLISAMPKITHLELHHKALDFFAFWEIDFCDVFPCLDTLELALFWHDRDILSSLLKIFWKLQKLILSFHVCVHDTTFQVLSDVTSWEGVEVLELRVGYDATPTATHSLSLLEEVISNIRKMGVVVIIQQVLRVSS